MAGRLFPAGGGRSIPLTKQMIIVGRATGCDVRLNDSVVSNQHCAFIFLDNCWTIQDLASRNGTAVNNTVIKKHVLKSGDTICISRKYRFVIEFDLAVERERFAALDPEAAQAIIGDDRNYGEHGPATRRLEPEDKDIWSRFKG